MNKAAFYDSLRTTLYSPFGVAAMAIITLDAIAAQAAARKVDIYDVAYMMATAFHEVGPTLLPKRESLNYSVDALLGNFSRARISAADAQRLGRKPGEGPLSEARQIQIANKVYGGEWGRKNLGNTGPSDGWLYRGGGLPQTTGRRNYLEVSKLTAVDLVARPDLIVRADIAVHALVACMIEGTYTGKKLSDFILPSQFKEARAIINPDVAKNGEKIAGHARDFLTALQAGGYGAAAPVAFVSTTVDELLAPVPANQNAVKTETPKASPVAKTTVATTIGGAVLLAYYQIHDAVTAKACAWLSLFCGG